MQQRLGIRRSTVCFMAAKGNVCIFLVFYQYSYTLTIASLTKMF